MAFRFWRRVRIAPGVTLNLSKSGGSLSFGPRGAKVTVGPRGKRATVGIPGTGLFYSTTFGSGRKGDRPPERLTLGFFQRLITPDDEEALVGGCRELVLGNEDAALQHLRQAAHLADAAFLAGCLALRKEYFQEAAAHLTAALDRHDHLGRHFSKYGIAAEIHLPITDEVSAHVGPDIRGVLLALVEAHQALGRRQDAIHCLRRMRCVFRRKPTTRSDSFRPPIPNETDH